jgi:hypothetical protein
MKDKKFRGRSPERLDLSKRTSYDRKKTTNDIINTFEMLKAIKELAKQDF